MSGLSGLMLPLADVGPWRTIVQKTNILDALDT